MRKETKVIREYVVYDINNNVVGVWNNPKKLIEDLKLSSSNFLYDSINKGCYIKNNKYEKILYKIELTKEKKTFEIETVRKKQKPADLSEYHKRIRTYIEEIPSDAKEVPWCKGLYVRKNGEVIGTDTNGYYIITPYLNMYKGVKKGYYKFHYNKQMHRLHYLLARLFVPGYKDGLVVDHIDNDSTNNDISNLQWISRGENVEKFWDSLTDEEWTIFKKKYSNGLRKAHAEGKYKEHYEELKKKKTKKDENILKEDFKTGVFLPRELTEKEIDDLNKLFEKEGE